MSDPFQDLLPFGLQDQDLDLNMNNEAGLADSPLLALRPSSLQHLSSMLNPLKVIPTESGLPRDWRGLAELGGMTSETMSYLESRPDPTADLIRKFSTLAYSHIKSVEDLRAFLALIDRYDVLDDLAPFFEKDILLHSSRVGSINTEQSAQDLDPDSERQALTYDDVSNLSEVRTRYDAFILYADEDSEFAEEILRKMEQEYRLKMCVKERDVMPGVMFEHEAIGRLIEERCNRLLVIFSPSFLQSRANQFLVSYTQALALELRQRKIIPCMYKRCELPPSVRYSFCLDYNRSGKLWNFWDRLGQSLSPVPSASAALAIPTRNGIGAQPAAASLPESYSWWEAEKAPRSRSSYSTSDSAHVSQVTNFDSVSLSSEAPLVEAPKGGSKKWYKKMMRSPGKKKREKEKQKEALSIAE